MLNKSVYTKDSHQSLQAKVLHTEMNPSWRTPHSKLVRHKPELLAIVFTAGIIIDFIAAAVLKT